MNNKMEGQVGVGNGLQRSFRMQDFASPGVIMRERSFIRPQSHHNMLHNQFPHNGKRKSMILTNSKGKPTLEIYRPPGVRTDAAGAGAGAATAAAGAPTGNKLNVHAKEFTMTTKPVDSQVRPTGGYSVGLQHSRSAVLGQLPHFRSSAVPQHPLATSASSASVTGPRVHFKLQPQPVEKKKSPPSSLINGNGKSVRPQFVPGLKRSKSLTSADALATGMAALGLAADAGDLGAFPPNVQDCIDKALDDPNGVGGRTLMEAVGHIVSRAVESPRYALPAARRCVACVDREHTTTFLETLLNTCQQWYLERDRLLGAVVGGGRPRLMAFLSFLLELYCQLRRRAARGPRPPSSAGSPPAAAVAAQPQNVLLALIAKCCEDTVTQPQPSPADTENLFFVLTYIGRDLEAALPGQLERLLAGVRDAFLNAACAPSIRRTLLQLIELHASRWQLPGCAVLYYYPSSK